MVLSIMSRAETKLQSKAEGWAESQVSFAGVSSSEADNYRLHNSTTDILVFIVDIERLSRTKTWQAIG
jgi:hypothetical protein